MRARNPGRPPEIDVPLLERLWQRGERIDVIARRVACSRAQVFYWRAKLNLPRRVGRGQFAHGTQEPPHGTVQRYKYRRDPCRCEPCSDAAREYRRTRRTPLYACPGCGTRALKPIGHSNCVRAVA
jgi:hypothetical protein